ncbi:MAG: response regulator [SAR324 cluster bacterium]|nr:response regulator [SAR324 cluster bacterium]
MAQILVVDDSSGIRNQVSTFLKDNGYTVNTAEDGSDGLNKVKADHSLKLLIVDVNMPDMDGLTMVEKIRGELHNDTVNILMLTTESQPAMKERAKRSGVKGWLVKPFNGPGTLPIVKKLIG